MLKSLLKGFVQSNARRTANTLGDRSTYIGLSTVGKAFGCFRAAVASRVNPVSKYPSLMEIESMTDEQMHKAIEAIRPLERGHEQETGLAAAFAGRGLSFLQQLEIRVEHEGVHVHGHLDFVICHEDKIEVIESKSNQNIPDVLYREYEAQLYAQMGMLARFYKEPVFSVRDEETGEYLVENEPFQVVAYHFGINVPSACPQVEGWVLSMNATQVVPFGPYAPNEMMTDICLRKAAAIWRTAEQVADDRQSLDELEYVRGFNPLCDFCVHNAGCPKYKDAAAGDKFAGTIFQIKELEGQKKALDADLKALKKELQEGYAQAGLDGNDWIKAPNGRFRHVEQTRKTLDKKFLIERLVQDGRTEEEAQEVIEECTKQTSFMKLDIGQVNLHPPQRMQHEEEIDLPF